MAGDNAGDPIRCAIAEQVASLPVIERAVRADADDAVHQLRVSIRRIRSLLRAVPGGSARLDEGEAKLGPPHEHSGSARLDEGEAKLGPPHEHSGSARLDDELRWLAGVLGTARDTEVLAQRYRRALHRIAPSLVRGRVAERLVDAAAQRYRAGWAQSVAALDSPRYRRLLAGLETVAAGQSTAPADESAGSDTATVAAAYRRVRKAAKATRVGGTGHDDEALHRIRKAAKRLRYTAAAMGAPSIEEQAKTIQNLLGEHQDSVVSREHLLTESRAAEAAGEDTFTYGLLYQQERDIARTCRAQLDQALDELAESMAVLRGG
ncbi:CHAD domain-containing protein [Mycolicibacter algericus]|uniref:CHAD domain-containing protein n=1 Tax=Mycolicibacter algericus TaxID=1288388 RepID=A0A7I9Y7J4_MYCAL|nr:CHAD domain-containing protein [Mycolicibacter algericus]GFG84648.1 hypothetical protein MALGJ_13240 [Mycolicibacter algericus]